MANAEHLKILKQGVKVWNDWRENNPDISPDFRNARLVDKNFKGANLRGATFWEADLRGTDFSLADLRFSLFYKANLTRAILNGANLFRTSFLSAKLREASLVMARIHEAELSGANLSRANLYKAYLVRSLLISANFSHAILIEADLGMSEIIGSNLRNADLRDAHLGSARLIYSDFKDANLEGCRIFGSSAWNVKLQGANQSNLIITPKNEPIITVDNLEVAQFIYLMLNNEKVRDVINTITSKVVLILGRFTPERKIVLDIIRDELRKLNYLPVLFDFENPANRDITETVSTLAHMARFVIADITDAKSIPQELQRIVPHLPSVPIQPLLQSSSKEYGMFEHFKNYPWVLEPYRYRSLRQVRSALLGKIIKPAESKAKNLERKRRSFEKNIARGRDKTSSDK